MVSRIGILIAFKTALIYGVIISTLSEANAGGGWAKLVDSLENTDTQNLRPLFKHFMEKDYTKEKWNKRMLKLLKAKNDKFTNLGDLKAYLSEDESSEKDERTSPSPKNSREEIAFEIQYKHSEYNQEFKLSGLQIFFKHMSKAGVDPRILELVCKQWYNAMRYRFPENGVPLINDTGIPFSTQKHDYFMEYCMRLYLDDIVSRLTLIYNKGLTGKERTIRFADSSDLTANLSVCEDKDKDKVVFTLNEERLFESRGANEHKVLTFISPFYKASHLFPTVIKPRVRSLRDIVVTWSWGNLENPTDLMDFIIINPRDVADDNSFEIWGRSTGDVNGKKSHPWVYEIHPWHAYTACRFHICM